jgi:hypothetical protein
MRACNCEIWRTTHAFADRNTFCPKYQIDCLRPSLLITVDSLEQRLTNIEMQTFNKTICMRIVTRNANMHYVIFLHEIFQSLQKCRTVISDNFSE